MNIQEGATGVFSRRRGAGGALGLAEIAPKEARMCRNIKTLHNFKPPATDCRACAQETARAKESHAQQLEKAAL